MVLGSTQPLVKMSTRNIPGGKGGRCVRLTTYLCAVVKKSRSLNFLDPSGPAMPVMDSFTIYLYSILCILCVCIVFCTVSPFVYIAVSFLFFYMFTDHCYRVETQLLSIHITTHHSVSYHIQKL